MRIIPVVLSGGSGTRLWPLSRASFPKQLIPLIGENTMIQETVRRLDGLETLPPIVVCNERHRFIIAEQLNQIGIKNPAIILEPVAKNTAPAICAACIQAEKTDKDAVVVVLPSDHSIQDREAFRAAVRTAAAEAEKGSLVTFGIKPTFAATGYGYIESDGAGSVSAIKRFVEKPDLRTAQSYLGSGNFLWNSGMFVFKPSVFLSELRELNKAVLEATEKSLANARTDLDFIRLDEAAFSENPSISIDYAVMEKTKKGRVVPLDAQWNDVGSWDSLWAVSDKDSDGNAIKGTAVTSGVKDSLIYSKGRIVAAVGVENMVIVDTKDALLVADKSKAEDVKKIVDSLKEEGNLAAEESVTGYRPWGTYETVELGERFRVKRIMVRPGQRLSVQMHYHRAEHWIVVSGTAKVRNGDKEFLLAENQSTFIPLGTVHAIENPGKFPLEFIEVQSGSYLEEDDIVRFEDKYGRI